MRVLAGRLLTDCNPPLLQRQTTEGKSQHFVTTSSEFRQVFSPCAAYSTCSTCGCTWGDVDHATHAFGLAMPGGIISTTGVGGLTLGGGLGYLTRKYGLAIDNLLAVDMVLADGRFVTVSAEEHEELFWAIRGGGGNFGIITSFLFQLYPLRTVYAGPMLWPLDRATEAMQFYRDFITQAPDEINGFFAFLRVPPGPPFPAR